MVVATHADNEAVCLARAATMAEVVDTPAKTQTESMDSLVGRIHAHVGCGIFNLTAMKLVFRLPSLPLQLKPCTKLDHIHVHYMYVHYMYVHYMYVHYMYSTLHV